MSSTSTISSIYFIGIGGIGMSALARYFKFRGAQVSGYDKTETALTRALVNEGIEIHYHESLELIPKEVDVVVYTPAIPAHHAERVFYESNGYRVVKRSDILQWITEHSFNICVAGTHGKTTVSTMIAHLLRDSQYGCNAFLGGIAANYQTNFWSSERDVAVIEADEYDRSFLKLSPDIAVITAVDADHLVVVAGLHPVHAEQLELLRDVVAGGGQKAAVPHAAEVLGRVEAEAADVTDRARAAAVPRGEDRLGGVFDDRQACRSGDRQQGVHVGRATKEVHRHEGLGSPADLLGYVLSPRWQWRRTCSSAGSPRRRGRRRGPSGPAAGHRCPKRRRSRAARRAAGPAPPRGR